MMALKLNEKLLIKCVLENIPYSDSKLTLIHRCLLIVIQCLCIYYIYFLSVELTVTNLPDIYVEKVLKFIASELEVTRHIHFYLLWIETIMTKHGPNLSSAFQMPILLMLQKNMQKKYHDLSKM